MGLPNRDTLFVTDLDGTLLRSDLTISGFTADVLNTAIADGKRITFATARTYSSASALLRSIHFNMPAIVCNGVHLVDMKTGNYVVSNLLREEQIGAIAKLARDNGLPLFAVCEGEDDSRTDILVCEQPVNRAQQSVLEQRDNRGQKWRIAARLDRLQSVSTVFFVEKTEMLHRFRARLEQDEAGPFALHLFEDLLNPGYSTLQVSHILATKGRMLQTMLEEMGEAAAEVVVFGDQLNDRCLFEAASRRIAVGNAHPAIARLADQVIGTNDEDGVAKFIHHILEGDGTNEKSRIAF